MMRRRNKPPRGVGLGTGKTRTTPQFNVTTPGFLALQFGGHDLVDVAPYPRLAGLNGAHERMQSGMEVFCGVAILRRVAASDVAAFEAEAQVHPLIAGLQALFAAVLVG